MTVNSTRLGSLTVRNWTLENGDGEFRIITHNDDGTFTESSVEDLLPSRDVTVATSAAAGGASALAAVGGGVGVVCAAGAFAIPALGVFALGAVTGALTSLVLTEPSPR